jgi:hypothetical protein
MNTEKVNPNKPKLIKTPSHRAAVVFPTAIFVLVDAALLASSGAPVFVAIVFSALTAAIVGWFLNRNYKRRLALDTRLNAAVEIGDTQNSADNRADKSSDTSSNPLLPPVGSWANPSKSQKFRQKWGPGSNRRR